MHKSDDEIILHVDVETAKLLRAALYALGEHQAAGAPIPFYNGTDSRLLGKFLSDLDVSLGGTGRMA